MLEVDTLQVNIMVEDVSNSYIEEDVSITNIETTLDYLVQVEPSPIITSIISEGEVSELKIIEGETNIIEIIETPASLITFTDIGLQGMRGAQGIQGESATLTIPELLGMFKQASTSLYTEYTKVGSNITKVEVWDTTEKTTKLFNKDITYLNGAVIGYIISDLLDNKILTVTYIFDVDGGIISKEINII